MHYTGFGLNVLDGCPKPSESAEVKRTWGNFIFSEYTKGYKSL